MLSIFRYFFTDLGIDLGTANTIIFAEDRGFVLNQPSVIALDQSNRLVACGTDAKNMMGKTGNSIQVIRPLADGVIANFVAGEEMVKAFIRNASVSRFKIGKVVIGVPTGITEVEKQAVIESAEIAGAREVHLIAEPMAAAIGSNINVLDNKAHMVVDIGGGTTDIAVINLGGIVVDNTIRIAGDEMNEAVMRHLKQHYHLVIGEATSEKIKIRYGTVSKQYNGKSVDIRGMDLVSGLPRRLALPNSFLIDALQGIVDTIVHSIVSIFEKLPLNLVDDIVDSGIILTGGGALLKGLDELISEKTRLKVHVSSNAFYSVAEGTRRVLENFNHLRIVLMNDKRH